MANMARHSYLFWVLWDARLELELLWYLSKLKWKYTKILVFSRKSVIIFKDAHFFFKNNFILPIGKLPKSGAYIPPKKRNYLTAVPCMAFLCHGITDCFVQTVRPICVSFPKPVWYNWGVGYKAVLEPFHLWSTSYNMEYSKYLGLSLANKLVILAMHEDTDLGLN